MEGQEALEHFERAEELAESRERFGRHAAVLVAILAALLAIATLAANQASDSILLNQAKASDAFNEAQANSLKRHLNDGEADLLRLLAAGAAQAGAAKLLAGKLERRVAQKYRPREDALLAKARGFEHERDRAEHRHRGFQLAEAAFQIAIVLTSVAIVARLATLVLLSSGLGMIGLLLLIDGFTFFWRFPLTFHFHHAGGG